MSLCKDCAHYHDEYKEASFFRRVFWIRTEFDERCNHVKFVDQVSGRAEPCITLRIMQCEGLPPYFEQAGGE